VFRCWEIITEKSGSRKHTLEEVRRLLVGELVLIAVSNVIARIKEQADQDVGLIAVIRT